MKNNQGDRICIIGLYPFFEPSTGVEVEIITGVNFGVHVFQEGVGRRDAAGRVADAGRLVTVVHALFCEEEIQQFWEQFGG